MSISSVSTVIFPKSEIAMLSNQDLRSFVWVVVKSKIVIDRRGFGEVAADAQWLPPDAVGAWQYKAHVDEMLPLQQTLSDETGENSYSNSTIQNIYLGRGASLLASTSEPFDYDICFLDF